MTRLNFILMNKVLNILVLLLLTNLAIGQIYQPITGYGFRWNRGMFDSSLHIPTGSGSPSGPASLLSNIKNKSALYYDSTGKKLWVFSPKDSIWRLAGVDTARFTQDVTVNGPAGTSVGVYGNGQTIPLTGKTLDQFATTIAVKAVPPTYYSPSASISSSPGAGLYERGSAINITLSGSYIQNDGGASSTVTYRKNGSALGGNTDNITSLTSQVGYDVQIAYAQGACKNNNLGVQDCTGRINAGTATSGSIYITPFDKRYWGFASSQSPSNSTILALTQDNNGSTGSLSLSNITPSGSQFIMYLTKGSVSSVVVNGIPATEAFTITTRTVTNAQGFASTYTYVYSNQAQTSTINSIVFN